MVVFSTDNARLRGTQNGSMEGEVNDTVTCRFDCVMFAVFSLLYVLCALLGEINVLASVQARNIR